MKYTEKEKQEMRDAERSANLTWSIIRLEKALEEAEQLIVDTRDQIYEMRELLAETEQENGILEWEMANRG